MPFFRSTSPVPITFDAGDQRYVVPPGAICEIDRRYAYVPQARRLPLVPVDRKEVEPQTEVIEPKPAPKPAPKRVKGVASGQTVLESDDGDDRVGEVISPARAALLDTVGEDGEADAPVGVPAAVADAVKGRAKKD